MKDKMSMITWGFIPVVSLADAAPPPSCLGQVGEEALFWVCLIAVASLCVAFLSLYFLKRRGVKCAESHGRDRKKDQPADL